MSDLITRVQPRTIHTLSRPRAARQAVSSLPQIAASDDYADVPLRPRHGVASRARLRYRLIGPAGAPVVVVQGGISAHRVVCPAPAIDRSDTPTPWWPQLVGAGGPVDTRRCRVLCVDWITPVDVSPAASAKAEFANDTAGTWRAPTAIDTTDQADTVAALLRRLDISTIESFIGASYGGMVGLAFAARHRSLLSTLVVISAAHRSDPYATALRMVQRRIVELGRGTDRADDALALARQLAMTTFRTPEEFAERFPDVPRHVDGEFSCGVGDYLTAVGEKFVARCGGGPGGSSGERSSGQSSRQSSRQGAERFLALSDSIDTHDVDPAQITTPTTLVAVRSDRLIRTEQMRELANRLGGTARLCEIDSVYGHDAFLKEVATIGGILTAALTI